MMMTATQKCPVVFYDATISEPEQKLYQCNEIISADKIAEPGIYQPNSFIPNGILKPLVDKQVLSDNTMAFDVSKSVYILKLPESLIGYISNLGIQDFKQQNDLQALKVNRGKALKLFQDKLKLFLGNYCKDINSINLHDIYIGEKGARTSTINFQHEPRLKTGLHLDSWDQLGLSDLKTANNRVCFNLGKSHRYFVFIDVPFVEIVEKYLGYNIETTTLSSYELVRMFLEKFPNYPCIYIKLAPFEGYFAPTESFIHDGSNFDSNELDIQITARGKFSPVFLEMNDNKF